METSQSRAIFQLIEVLYQTQLEKAMIVCDQIAAEKNNDTDSLLEENKKLFNQIRELIDQHDSEMDRLMNTVDIATQTIAIRNGEIHELMANLKLSQDHASDLLKEVKSLVFETGISIPGSGYPLLTYALYEKVNDAKST